MDGVVISCGSEVIARHPRSYQRDDFVYDPVHYLPLLEQKTAALDQAAPLRGWDLPEEFGTLRRLLESRMGPMGKREFVQVLRLLESFSLEEVHSAVRDSLRLGALSFDAVKHLVLCRLEGRPPRLDLELYRYLPRVRVNTTSAGDYMTLLSSPFNEGSTAGSAADSSPTTTGATGLLQVMLPSTGEDAADLHERRFQPVEERARLVPDIAREL